MNDDDDYQEIKNVNETVGILQYTEYKIYIMKP